MSVIRMRNTVYLNIFNNVEEYTICKIDSASWCKLNYSKLADKVQTIVVSKYDSVAQKHEKHVLKMSEVFYFCVKMYNLF